MIGFTTMFQQNLASLAMAKRIKETHPDIRILFGGPNAEGDMGAGLMECFPFLDYVFSGESDHTFPTFVQAVLTAKPGEPLDTPLDGIHSRDIDGTVRRPSQWGEPINDMDALPYPNFDDFFPQFHTAFPDLQPHLNYETARGCWWGAKSHCTFCGLNGVTMAFRSKSADRAIEEIQYLHQHYMDPYRVLLMQPADQILDLRYFESMIPRLPEAAPGVPTFFEVKANLTRGQVKALAAAQVQIIQPGIESLSSQVLTLMRKGCTLLQNVQLLKWCAEFGLHPIWNWLYGFPGECEEDYQQMSEIVPMVTHLQPPKKFFAIELDRFSPYFTAPDKLGVQNIRPPEILSVLYPFTPEQQYDICYTFDFDYTEPREATTYLGSSRERVLRLWMKTRQRGAVVGLQTAERLVIWDSRIGAVNPWVEIHGIYREALLLADKIVSDKKFDAFFTERLGEDHAVATREDFLTQMEQRGLVLRENERTLSLVVLSSIADQLPEVPVDQLVHVGHVSELDGTGSPATAPVTFGGKAVDEVLARPEDDSDRYQVVLAGSLIRTVDGDTEVIHGVCSVDSFWGVSAFRLTGTVRRRDSGQTQLYLSAQRLSGFDAGQWTLSFASDQSDPSHTPSAVLSGTASYNDTVNTALSLRMEIEGFAPHNQHGQPLEMRFRATGEGFYYASFLASGESLGGAEG
jgi:ribosomal peptide maturation radical SAM protein 1